MDFSVLGDNLEKLGYKVLMFKDREDASSYLDSVIDGRTVGFGGSVTLDEMGIYDRLSKHNTVYWHWKLGDGDTIESVRMKAKDAAIYLSSVNGISEQGEIINIDGACNRVASTLYGHEKVFFVLGENKVAEDFDSALYRARNIAAPKNAKSKGAKTPCAVKADKCYNCNSPGRICRSLNVLWECPMGGDYTVILIHENLGF